MAIPAISGSRLLIDNFKIALRRPRSDESAAAAAVPTPNVSPTISRLRSLVDRIAERTLDAATAGDASDLQSSVDRTLAEIRLLIGRPNVATGSALLRGIDRDQIRDVAVRSAPPGTSETFSGTVSRARSAIAEIAGAGQVVQNGGQLTIDVGGRRETINVRPTSLDGLARTINGRELGVRASVDRGRLNLTTNQTGRGARFEVTAKAKRTVTTPGETTVAGVNASQIDSATAAGLSAGQSVTLSGSLDSVESAAALRYRGDGLGNVDGSATFRLTGSDGSADVSIVRGETLASVADRVNALTDQTEVTASVQGNKLTFKTVDYGSDAEVRVEQRLGTFATTGDGVGTDADVRIDGQSVAATGNELTYRDGLNEYALTLAAGQKGHTDITVTSQAKPFELIGGDFGGAAVGVDALLKLDGQTITGLGNDFRIQQGGIDLAFTVADGFAGVLDPITLRSDADPFELAGGDGAGHAVGTDWLATINGVAVTGTDGQFNVDVDGGQFTIDFAAGHIGSFDPMTFTRSTEMINSPVRLKMSPCSPERTCRT